MLTVLAASAVPATQATGLFTHNSASTVFSGWTSTTQKSHELQLGFDIPLFGTGTINEIFISNFGTLTYNSMLGTDKTVTTAGDNMLLAPFFVPTVGGTVQFEVLDNTYDYTEPNTNVNSYDSNAVFTATNGVLVTWTDVASETDSSKKNTFQAMIVTDLTTSWIVFNYDEIQYTQSAAGDDADAGLFVNSEDTNACYRYVNTTGELDRETLTTTTNCASAGHWVMQLDDILFCGDHFTTACGDDPPAGEWSTHAGYFENNDRWDYFVRYTCRDTLEIQPNVTQKDSYCVYDPDYYDSKWSCEEPPKCQDFAVSRQFETQVVVSQANGKNVTDLDFRIDRANIDEQISESVNTLLQAAGLEDGVVVDITTEKTNVETFRNLGPGQPEEVLVIEFTILVPTPGGGTGVTEEDIAAAINEVINNNPDLTDIQFQPETNVKDKTDACLTLCLGCRKPGGCHGEPPPIQHNSCCGTCTSLNYEGGKAYSTLTHACCGDTFVYDPDTHTCCDYGTQMINSWTKVKGATCS